MNMNPQPSELITGLIVTDQASWDAAMRLLANSPAAMRVVRINPLCGPIKLGVLPDLKPDGVSRSFTRQNIAARRMAYDRQAMIGWLVVGAYLSDNPVPWLRNIMRECKMAAVPLFILPPLDAHLHQGIGWPEDVATRRDPPRALVASPGSAVHARTVRMGYGETLDERATGSIEQPTSNIEQPTSKGA